MAKYEVKSLRNVAIVGHGGTGKTSLCESFLYIAGKSDRPGRVDEGTSCMDFEPEEQKRHISISAATNFFDWERHRVNIIDTPGDSNFTYDTKNCLRIVDGAIVLIDAVGGVEFQTETVWEYADEFKLPRVIYINRMDRERADFFKTVESIKTRLGKATPLFLPLGAEESFKGIVDLMTMKALIFDDPKGNYRSEDIPAEMMELVEKYREEMVEDIAESDEKLMDKYLEGGELSLDDLKAGLKKGVVSGAMIPIACGSAIKNIGVTPLMEMIVNYLPSPADRGPVAGKKPDTEVVEKRSPEESAPFSAMVFKTIADPYAGRLTLFRVYSGTVRSDSNIYNSSRKLSERFGNIFFLEGKNQQPAGSLIPGDIAAVAKLKETATGDTICDEKSPVVYEKLISPPAITSFAVEPKTRGDEEKIGSSINRLVEEDPSLAFHRDEQTKEMILSGQGQVHIEVAVEKMRRKFGLEVNLKIPKVPYKETIKGKTRLQGKYKRQSGGRGQYGDTWLAIEPLPRGGGFEFVDKIVGGVIPQQYRPAVEKGIIEAMEEGELAGYPIVDVRVSLVDGSYHTVDSSEMAFKIAGSMGFKKGIQACQPVLLEPIVNIEIETPDEYMGDVIGDLNSRRGRVSGMDTRGGHQIVKAQVPLAEILKYAADLRSMTSGRGTFMYRHSHYEEVPPPIAEKIIAASKKKEE
ncbi:MAG: translation elongation factor G [Syntrophaceae bacterium CG2_30_49_12]|nr:MAG: translation elongation factor G [Syntrophaceae bacterium CG2_30_49_12]PIP05101.1 MAG: elongation factor G [Syntrophobacterales bacterium CG23_combo_of_CG06-09_8_20_14_all_48_27]PJA48695.1 MAG: elongation factor G [Syntrophobacterales bacterium CG_4_9_14_3_um_filter_49_8]PJC75654.1 MAG: elongation factor G [Syntrophobacterales bacterium CG_4_8_14_3_um_filter_49_14]